MQKITSKIYHLCIPLLTREFLTNPSHVGSVIPSSSILARKMAKHVPQDGNGLVIELGAGTGVVTKALLNHGIAGSRIKVIERSPKLVNHLREHFPELSIICGDAAKLGEIIQEHDQPISAIVSSLPLRSIPKDKVELIAEELEKVLVPGSLFIQYTYLKDHAIDVKGLKKIHSEWVLFNIPPARIDVFKYE